MNKELIYEVYLPTYLEEGKKYPVIYAMHGMGGNEQDVISVVEELKDEFIIIGIRGPLTINSGFAYFTIKSFGNPNIDSLDEGVEKLAAFIRRCPEKYPISLEQQFLLGFSQGAILSMTLALTSDLKMKGIVALSGYIPKHVKEKAPILKKTELAIFIVHGEFDRLFPLDIGKENYEFFSRSNQSLQFNSYPMDHEISLEEKKDIIKWLKENK